MSAQCLVGIIFHGEENKGITSGSSICLVHKQNALISIQHLHWFVTRPEEVKLWQRRQESPGETTRINHQIPGLHHYRDLFHHHLGMSRLHWTLNIKPEVIPLGNMSIIIPTALALWVMSSRLLLQSKDMRLLVSMVAEQITYNL